METEKKTLDYQIRKSQLRASTVLEYEFLTQYRVGFIPCQIEERAEDVIFHFDISGLRPLQELKDEEKEYKYRFLQNLKILQGIWEQYDINVKEENLYFDYNYIPYIAMRDISKEEKKDFYEFAKELAAGILCKKYSYTQIQESGIEIVKKQKAVRFIFTCTNIQDFFNVIEDEAQKQYEANKSQKIRVNKKRYLLQCRIILIVLVMLMGLLIYTGYKSFVVLPRSKDIIQASRGFIVQDYTDCIDKLSKISTDQMDTYTKYILAVSYAKTEALETEELENVLSRLSIYSNNAELEYWIAVGRAQYEKAENKAMALSDDKLLIYAYMKELNALEGNITMDGEEKQNRMNTLSNEITAIGEKYVTESEN